MRNTLMAALVLVCFAANAIAARVLFLGSDGMSAAVLRRPDIQASVVRGLMARGAWSLKARTILPSSSASNWAAIFQCSGPEQNGYND